MLNNILQKITVWIMTRYIEFVYHTSDVHVKGKKDILTETNSEKVIAIFWHGDSYCLYPALSNSKIYIATTKDRRGDYIADMCDYFGYKTIRLPDTTDGSNYIFKIGKIINGKDINNLAIALDGPLGPYHEPKELALVIAFLTNRRVMPVSIDVKRKIQLKRWDKFKIPLPCNKIVINFHEPIEINRQDKEEKFTTIKTNIKFTMENAVL